MGPDAFEEHLVAARIIGATLDGVPSDPRDLSDADRMAIVMAPYARFARFTSAFCKSKGDGPTLPALPRALEPIDWAASYRAAAPFTSPFWIGFWHSVGACPYQREWNVAGWSNGRATSGTKSAGTFREYVARCRAALAEAGWEEGEIP